MSAAAVWAVRRGLRMEFSRPSLPGSPSTRASGRPIAPESGRAAAGASMAAPTKMHTEPTPTSCDGRLGQPDGQHDHAGQGQRRRPRRTGAGTRRSLSDRRSSSAATGGMRTARRAGPIADTTVTPTPTTSPTTTVRGSKTSDPAGSVTPNPRSSASSPTAASTPRPSPITDETSPTTAASAEHRTEHLTAARTDDPQQGQLPGPLPDDDRERVEDGERADEQGDEREHQQRGVEEGERLVDRVRAPR